MAQAREARKIEEQAAEAVRRALPAEFVAEIEGRDPEARKRKRIEGGFGLAGYEAPDDVYFARGANAVNAVGREGFDLEDEQRLMIEAAEQTEKAEAEENGIFRAAHLRHYKAPRAPLRRNEKRRQPQGHW